MRALKNIVDFYINSSIHVALAVFALSWVTLLEFDLKYDESILFFIFFSTITGYNFVKYFGLAKFHHRSLAIWLKAIQVFSFICFLALCYYAFKLETKTMIYIGAFSLITFLYAIPMVPKTIFIDKKKNLRSISGLKVYVIAFVWSGVTVFLPLLNGDYTISNDVILSAIQRFIFVIVLMLPFEVRDLSYDSIRLSTIPQKIGVLRTKILGVVLLVMFLCLDLFKEETTGVFFWVQMVIIVITLVLLLFSREHQTKYYSAFWVESIPILWMALLLVFR
ncbi:hypothetical protein [Psychroserpens sp. SPM9]|uniref:hypothetical protein n=1 Tax=Psychroserpens sp. SPM9 TaxID=2975598 RepID=UPI0021A7675F|nr:hypothetical protein [Psychroserpens sp. SPM9]MDG5492518.1 hypothetical protein [Psychroserpens sp. SPM9]